MSILNSGTFYAVDLELGLALEFRSRALVEVFQGCINSAQTVAVLVLDCLEILVWIFERFH